MQSTKACSGDPYSPDYFTLQDTTGYYYSRRRTLFNIYAFAEHTTLRNATPELVIENSQFEYFLANGYESLITIETYTLNQVIVLEKTYAEGQSGSTNNFHMSPLHIYIVYLVFAHIQITITKEWTK